jgi:hypothetical protein
MTNGRPRARPTLLGAAAATLALAGAAGCSPLNFAREEALVHLPDEELCGRRSNLVNGALMARELARRGVDCTPYDEAALRQGFRLGFLAPPAPPPAARSILPPSQIAPPAATLGAGDSLSVLPPVAAGPAESRYFQPSTPLPPPVASSVPAPLATPPAAPVAPAQEASRVAPPPPAATPVPAAPAPPRPSAAQVAAAAVPSPAPPPAPPPAQPAASGAAPFVTPACAAREVRQEDGRSTVAFRNTCAFPVRVLYAQRPDGALGAATGLLRPGETSPPAPLEAGFRQPGYVVCSYQSAPESAPCRLQ